MRRLFGLAWWWGGDRHPAPDRSPPPAPRSPPPKPAAPKLSLDGALYKHMGADGKEIRSKEGSMGSKLFAVSLEPKQTLEVGRAQGMLWPAAVALGRLGKQAVEPIA